jgi:predicted SAM-dependent methyltransferase
MAEYTLNDRKRDRALAGLDLSLLHGVEVGPLDRPLVTRAMSDVYYVDHASNDDLKRKFTGDPHVDTENIPRIDYVWKDKTLVEMIGDKAPLDYIVASHVIEHVPDLVGWLEEMLAALSVGGKLILVVPDKRFTFDIFRRVSAFEEVESAHREMRRRPGLRCIMDHFSNVVSANTWALWDNYAVSRDFKFSHGPEFLTLAHKHYHEGLYVDVHCWVFTPWSFVELLGQIAKHSKIGFDLSYFLTTQSHDLEFYVQLTRVDVSSTDWEEAATKEHNGALWPAHGLNLSQLGCPAIAPPLSMETPAVSDEAHISDGFAPMSKLLPQAADDLPKERRRFMRTAAKSIRRLFATIP